MPTRGCEPQVRLSAIVFDLGGVLLDAEEAHANAARLAAQDFSLPVSVAEWECIRGSAYEDFFYRVLASPANIHRRADLHELVARAYDLYLEQVVDSADLIPYALEALKVSRASFEFVAVATSSEGRLVDTVLRRFHLTEYFDCVVSGDHLTQKKPAPEAFLVVAWLLGIKPGSMVVVEDSEPGIRAARLARTHVVKIDSKGDDQASLAVRAHQVVRGHRELIAYIRALEERKVLDGR